jgi:Flp pilus assembly protein TadG
MTFFSRQGRLAAGVRRWNRFVERRTGGSSESGVALIEFVLVLPLLLVFLLGILDFGKGFNYWIDETHLANQGARWAAVNNPGPAGTIQESIRERANTAELRDGGTSAVANPLEVCVAFEDTDDDGDVGVGDAVHVTTRTTYNWLGFLDIHLGGTTQTDIEGNATMRLEAVPDEIDEGC